MLKTRIITGAFITIIMALILVFSNVPWVLNTAIACLCLLSIDEFYKAAGMEDNKPVYYITCAFAVTAAIVPIPGYDYIIPLMFAAAVVMFSCLMAKAKTAHSLSPWLSVLAATMFIFFYKAISGIRAMEHGVYLLAMAVLTPVLTDIFAYFIGKCYGKHKLAPVISPKKTIEGSIGGTIAAVSLILIAAALLDFADMIGINYTSAIIYLIPASVIGQFGDLALSGVKRIVGIKDYGKILPGHGGILDRFDSILFVLPFTYMFCMYANPVFI